MTATGETTKKMDFRKLELRVGDTLKINGKNVFIYEATSIESYGKGKRLVSFVTLRRAINEGTIENEGIEEARYSVNGQTGEEHQDYSGIYYEKDSPSYSASKRYTELNEFLQSLEK